MDEPAWWVRGWHAGQFSPHGLGIFGGDWRVRYALLRKDAANEASEYGKKLHRGDRTDCCHLVSLLLTGLRISIHQVDDLIVFLLVRTQSEIPILVGDLLLELLDNLSGLLQLLLERLSLGVIGRRLEPVCNLGREREGRRSEQEVATLRVQTGAGLHNLHQSIERFLRLARP